MALLAAGVASAAAGVMGDDPTETTQPTQVAQPPATPDVADGHTEVLDTTTTTVPDVEEVADLEESADPEDETFGQIISALRAAGDHTPAAVVMGKDVPGWDSSEASGLDDRHHRLPTRAGGRR